MTDFIWAENCESSLVAKLQPLNPMVASLRVENPKTFIILIKIITITLMLSPSESYANSCSNFLSDDQARTEQIIALYRNSESSVMQECVRWLQVGGPAPHCTYRSEAWQILVQQFGLPGSQREARQRLCRACSCPGLSTLAEWAGQGRSAQYHP